jgi:DNA-binding Xre family transcriptional regulator
MKLDYKVIRVLMAQHGLDGVAALARATGLHRNALDRLFAGENDPSLATLGALCRALHCTPNDILILEDDPGRDGPKAAALIGIPKTALEHEGALA